MIYVNARFITKKVTGVERYAVELSRALKKIDQNILFVSPKNKFINSNIKNLETVEAGYFNNYLWEQIELPLFLYRNKKPLLVNPVNTAPIFYDNQILVVHDIAFLHNPEWYTKKAAVFFKFIVGKSIKASKKIITVSNFSKNELIKYLKIPPEKIEVIHSGIPSSILKYANYNYPNEFGDYILSVSSLEPRKNIKSLIEAFIKLNRKDIKLIIVGKKNPLVFNDAKLGIGKHDNIIFLGYVEDEALAKLYKNARLFAYLSYYEGFGFPPVEAIACGCPTMVSNTSSLPEICGENAEYCDPQNINEITGKIESMLSEYKKPSNERITEFIKKYEWQKTANKMLDIIRQY